MSIENRRTTSVPSTSVADPRVDHLSGRPSYGIPSSWTASACRL